MHENSEGIIKIYGGIALDAICDSVICRHHTCNVQCCRGRKEKRVLPNKVGNLSYVVELSADLGLLSVFTFEYHGAPISFGTEHPQHFLPHLVGIDTEPVLVAVFVFGDEFDIERRWLFCAFVIQQKRLCIDAFARCETVTHKVREKIHAFEQIRLAGSIITINDSNRGNPVPCPLLILCTMLTFAEHGKFLLALKTQTIFNSEIEQHSFRPLVF